MKRKIINFLQIGFTIYLMLLFCTVLPVHGHEDFETHDECTLCFLSVQPATVDTVFVYYALPVPPLPVITVVYRPISRSRIRFYPTRAPPCFI
jgi:hypothetical protein